MLYCYELQVSQRARRLGLGSTLMGDLENLAKQWRMRKVMLTCFLSASRVIVSSLRNTSSLLSERRCDEFLYTRRVRANCAFAPAPHCDTHRFKEDPISPGQQTGLDDSPEDEEASKDDEWEDEEEDSADYEILSKDVLPA